MKLLETLEDVLFALIVGLMAGLPLLVLGLIGYIAFDALVFSNFDIVTKAVTFILTTISFIITGMYIDLAWNSIKSENAKKEIIREVREKILKAKLELFVADTEIKEKDMFQNADALIKQIHRHIELAKEYLDEVY